MDKSLPPQALGTIANGNNIENTIITLLTETHKCFQSILEMQTNLAKMTTHMAQTLSQQNAQQIEGQVQLAKMVEKMVNERHVTTVPSPSVKQQSKGTQVSFENEGKDAQGSEGKG